MNFLLSLILNLSLLLPTGVLSSALSVVKIYSDDPTIGQCSAFSANLSGSYLTAEHCVGGHMIVFEDGKRYPALVVKEDKDKDLALLRADLRKVGIPLGVKPNDYETVYCLGFGVNSPKLMILEGRVQGTMELIEVPNKRLYTDHPTLPGMSGGPVLNESGALVGMNQMKSTELGLAVSASYEDLKKFLK